MIVKKIVTIHWVCFFIIFETVYLNAQNTENALYYIYQKSGTENLLQQYITQMAEKKEIDIDNINEVYINFIPPMGCPRCEGVVTQYNHVLSQLSDNKAFIINVLLYKKEKALSQYIHTQNFQGDILYVDTTDMFIQIFHVNSESAKLPYLTKISPQEGHLIWGMPTLGINLNESLVKEAIQKKSQEALHDEKKDYLSSKERPISLRMHIDKWNWQELWSSLTPKHSVDSFKIAGADILPIVTEFSINRQGDKLLVNNFVNSSFFLFSLKDNEWNAPITLSPTPDEEKMYIDPNISPFIYQYCKENNILVSMYLTAGFCDDGLYIMASLPKLIIEVNDSSAGLGYYNAPVCLIKNHEGMLMKQDFWGDDNKIDVKDKGYTFLHSSGNYFSEDDLFVFPLQKGWPTVGTSASPDNDNTPFSEEFYNQSNTLLFYHANNETLNITAPLNSLYKEYKLGYYYCNTLVKKCSHRYYWVDKKIGNIYQLSTDLKTSTLVCDLFNMDAILQPLPYSETLSYMDSYGTYFNKTVVDFEIFENDVCKAIIYDGTHYYLYQVKNKVVTHISTFSQMIGTLKLTGMQFGYKEQETPVIYGLYQNNKDIVTYLFEAN